MNKHIVIHTWKIPKELKPNIRQRLKNFDFDNFVWCLQNVWNKYSVTNIIPCATCGDTSNIVKEALIKFVNEKD